MADHVRAHGDGVRDIALWVDDARAAYALALERGAEPAAEPQVLEDDHGRSSSPPIQTYGDTIHSFVERKGYTGLFMPGFEPIAPPNPGAAGRPQVRRPLRRQRRARPDESIGSGSTSACWASATCSSFDDKDISTEYSSLMSKVMSNGNERIKFPINEPAAGQAQVADRGVSGLLRRSRRAAHRAGDQTTSSTTVSALRDRGVEFLTRARQLLRRSCRRASGRSTRTRGRSATSASWSTATTKVTCCRSSPSRCRIGRRSSTRSSSARARAASARAISRRSSRPSNASRPPGNL